jgi:hypothetical protein
VIEQDCQDRDCAQSIDVFSVAQIHTMCAFANVLIFCIISVFVPAMMGAGSCSLLSGQGF